MTDAAGRARAAIGLYGDPTASWSIVLEADLSEPVDGDVVSGRLAVAAAAHPNLGVPPIARPVPAGDWARVRSEFSDFSYGPDDPLVRVAVGVDVPKIVIAAHHGAVDGLGLLALLGIALDTPVRTEAAGVFGRPAKVSFVRSALTRLREALFAPPTRVHPTGGGTDTATGDLLLAEHLPRRAFGTAKLAASAAEATCSWNAEHGTPADRVVAGIGASRRAGAALVPDLSSTFFRLPLGTSTDEATVRALLARAAPEPDFPRSASVVARKAIRALAGRLGSTFLASNLGVVHAGETVRALSFHPAASGRSGVAFGAVTVGDTTTVTLRARRRDFDEAAATELLRRLLQASGVESESSRHG